MGYDMNRYIFTIGNGSLFSDEIELDTFYKLTSPKIDKLTYDVAVQIDKGFGKEDSAAYSGMLMRTRFADTSKILLLESDEELTRTSLTSILTGMTKSRLKQFVKEATI